MNREEEKKLESLSPFEVKNTLIDLAKDNNQRMMLNAGRGNPNWISTIPRSAFFQFGLFALEESKKTFLLNNLMGGMAKIDGIVDRFNLFIKKNNGTEGIDLLNNILIYSKDKLAIEPCDLLLEFCNGILGDFYPSPDRMLVCCENIVEKYLIQELSNGCAPPNGHYDLFATEGGTAAMTYVFNTLLENKLLKKGDKIAIGTPVFSPYLEIPRLNDFQFVEVEVMSNEHNNWKIPEAEIEKLLDPSIKAFFVVNPSNPPSARIENETLERIKKIVNEKRKNFIILTDDVYSTFTDGFVSLVAAIPKNTIGVYSFSKYFGCTGWRLGAIAIHQDNQFDVMLKELPKDKIQELKDRYSSVNLDPTNMKLIDRLVADSRVVALNHTAGLSTPQQIQMTLFALSSLIDTSNVYKKLAQSVVRKRYHLLYESTKIKPLIPESDCNNTFYYSEIDLLEICKNNHEEDFATWLVKNYEPLDFLIRLAKEKSIVLMPGGGFDAPRWSIRVSLANLDDQEYTKIGIKVQELLSDYYEIFKTQK